MIRKIKNKSILNLLGILVLIIVGGFLVYYLFDNFMTIEKIEIYTSFIADDHPGFDLDPDALTFGMVPIGGMGSRNINFTNEHDERARVIIKTKGEMINYLVASENDFILEPGEMKEIGFNVYPPKNLDFGLYDGEVIIVLRRVFD